jgi:hypothetical protein
MYLLRNDNHRVADLDDGDKDAEFELVWRDGKSINHEHLPNYCTPRKLLSQFADIRRSPGRVVYF